MGKMSSKGENEVENVHLNTATFRERTQLAARQQSHRGSKWVRLCVSSSELKIRDQNVKAQGEKGRLHKRSVQEK